MEGVLAYWLFFWVFLCIVAGIIANNKGRSGVGFFFLAFFLSPLVGIISALVSNENTEVTSERKLEFGDNKKCPFCAEIIKAEAIVCRYCGRDVEATPRQVEIDTQTDDNSSDVDLPEPEGSGESQASDDSVDESLLGDPVALTVVILVIVLCVAAVIFG